MTEADFKSFCNAMAQSCARQANDLIERQQALAPDEHERRTLLERRADGVRDLMEVYARAPMYWIQ